MPRISAGLLMYRLHDGKLQVLLAHPGGPFFKNKDDGDWTIPKGEVDSGEDLLETAKREFKEETGVTPADFFDVAAARRKIKAAQGALIEELKKIVKGRT